MRSVLFADTNYPQTVRRRQAAAGQESPMLAQKRVIIVEDEGITQIQLRNILTRAGMLVVGAARSGPEGVEVAVQEKPDLVLMDIRMPGEYDGLEAARRILAEQSICVVLLTAFNEEGYREQARKLGACGYIIKPIDRDTLLPHLEAAYESWKPE